MPADFLFHVHPASGVPIYRQLMDQVRRLAAGGRLKPGDFLPSVRQVAQELSVNPMTVSKAYSLLERDGLVESVRGTGMRLAPEAAENPASLRSRQQAIRPLLDQVAVTAHELGLSPAQIRALLDPLLEQFHDDRD